MTRQHGGNGQNDGAWFRTFISSKSIINRSEYVLESLRALLDDWDSGHHFDL